MPAPQEENHLLIAVLAVATLAVCAFLTGLAGDFVFDDRPFLIDNPKLVADHSLAWFFRENVWYYSNIPQAFSNSYRPLFFLILWLLNLFGLASPLGLHLFSLSLHLFATLLLLQMVRRLAPGVSPLALGLGIGLFAVHPVHVEAIAWSGAFTHPLAAVLLMGAWLAHDDIQQESNLARAFVSTGLFGMALLANEIAVGFPIFVLVSDWLRFGSARFHRSLPYFLLLIPYGYARSAVLGMALPLEFYDPGRWARFPVFLLEYLRHLVLPWPQPLYVVMPEDWAVSSIALVTALLSVAALLFLARIPSNRRRTPLVALTWIAAFLVPPMAAAFNPDALLALRSLYLPSAGLAMVLAWAVDDMPNMRGPAGLTIVVSVLVFFIGATVTGNRHWSNDGVVYERIIAWNPRHHAGYLGLGQYCERNGELEKSISLYRKSLLLADQTRKLVAMEYLAILLAKTGDTAGSLGIFRQMIAYEPENVPAWIGVGNNLWTFGELDAALEAYQKAHSFEPENQTACYNLALVLRRLGRAAEAGRYAECAQKSY